MICYKVVLISPPEESYHEQLLAKHGEFPIKFQRKYKAVNLMNEIIKHHGKAEVIRAISATYHDLHDKPTIPNKYKRSNIKWNK